MSFDNLLTHLTMLQDRVRTEAFSRAIQRLVPCGAVVLDFGCGTGILSFFASRSGASRVYAVDKSPIVRVAPRIAERNGFANITFLHSDETQLSLPEKVDGIVSEWMGDFGLCEQTVDGLVVARDRWLTHGGFMIPSAVSFRVGLVTDPSVFDRLAFFGQSPYGIDYSYMEDWPFHATAFGQLGPNQICEQDVDLGTVDMRKCPGLPSTLYGQVTLDNEVRVYGLCGWFVAHLGDGTSLGTGPKDPTTHWRQLLMPLRAPISVARGDTVRVAIRKATSATGDGLLWNWRVSAPAMSLEMDDYVYQSWIRRALPTGPVVPPR